MTKPTSHSDLPARFLSGSIMRHILAMSSTGAIGLVSLLLVELLDLFFLSMLGSEDIIAGIGFAGGLSFFTVSLSLGFSIAMATLVSRTIGQQNVAQARRYVVNVSLLALVLTSLFTVIIWFNLAGLFSLLGARDGALQQGMAYLQIVLLSLPVLATGLSLSAALRATGDAKLAMYSTLAGGIINAVLDPIFIFVLDMGVEGAALATALGRVGAMLIAWWGAHKKHRLLARFHLPFFLEDLKPIFTIAGPAMLTNIVIPIGNAIVIKAVAQFGAAYVAGFSVISRVAPVAFGVVFGLSGAVAPIIGQNYGARQFDRIKRTLRDALSFNAIYVCIVSVLLFLLQDTINRLFNLEGDAAKLMEVFCTWIAITYIFNGAQFIANAAFNNLGRPIYATWFTVGRATIGTLPFVMLGGYWGEAPGVLIGQAVGAVLFASAAMLVAFRHTHSLEQQALQLQAKKTKNSDQIAS